MYVLLNRGNIVVDILDNLRYIKLQSSNGIVVACSEEEGTGVIGSDCDTHYVLIQADTINSPNAVRVIEVEEIPSNVTPNLYKFDNETQSFVYRYSLDEAKELKQEKNKLLFAEYLASHPLTWTDGKEYGITMEDQSEISLNLSQYQIAIQAGTLDMKSVRLGHQKILLHCLYPFLRLYIQCIVKCNSIKSLSMEHLLQKNQNR